MSRNDSCRYLGALCGLTLLPGIWQPQRQVRVVLGVPHRLLGSSAINLPNPPAQLTLALTQHIPHLDFERYIVRPPRAQQRAACIIRLLCKGMAVEWHWVTHEYFVHQGHPPTLSTPQTRHLLRQAGLSWLVSQQEPALDNRRFRYGEWLESMCEMLCESCPGDTSAFGDLIEALTKSEQLSGPAALIRGRDSHAALAASLQPEAEPTRLVGYY